ncbi:hypothetical protein JW756_05205 [Candidatus Woesearchaeota archaeon]|nr:hypothetical protein [Candidatus Woesearchaeota archaeon]
MTNIGGIKVFKDPAKKKDSLDDHLVLVADSMGSFKGSETKTDNNQKLHIIGEKRKFILMGTGYGDMIRYVAGTLQHVPLDSLQEASDRILEITDNMSPPPGIKKAGLNFILGGNYIIHQENRRELGLAHILATVFAHDIKKKDPDYRRRGASLQPYVFDGSGSGFVYGHIENMYELGKDGFEDVADAMVLAYEFGKQGAKDSGVNDKLQFGIMNQNTAATIFHPDTILDSEELFVEYINRMCSIKTPPITNDIKGEARVNLINQRIDIKRFLSNFYDALTADLRDYSEMRKFYTQWAEAFANDPLNHKKGFDEMLRRRTLARKHVAYAADALLKTNLPTMIDYVKDFDTRKRILETRVLSLPEIYKA